MIDIKYQSNQISNTVIAPGTLGSLPKAQIFLSFFLREAPKTRRWKCAVLSKEEMLVHNSLRKSVLKFLLLLPILSFCAFRMC